MKIYVLMDLFFPSRPRNHPSNKFPFCFGIAVAVVFVLRFEGVFWLTRKSCGDGGEVKRKS